MFFVSAKPFPGHFDDFIKSQLMIISQQLGINYDDMGLGDYDPGRNTYFGWGSWGAIGLAGLLNFGSAIKRAVAQIKFETASTYAAMNNIIEYYNLKYHAAEYKAWLAKMNVEI